MYTEYDRMLHSWANEYRSKLDDNVRKLIHLATFDLHFSAPCDGSVNEPPTDEYGNENEWSGYDFERACELIKEACKDIPCVLYMDTDCGYWSENEPDDTEDCMSCDGNGENTDEEGEVWKCGDCCGGGRVAASNNGWYKVGREELLAAVLGKELVQYI